jgi:Domain of unknown function (DUF222)/HNH endonuclease
MAADARTLAAIGEQIYAAADPGGHLGEELSRHERRHLSISRGFEGMGEVTGRLDPVATERAVAVLEALARKAGPQDGRTAAQRRADAFDAMCKAWLASGSLPVPKDGAPRRDQIIVTIPYPALLGLTGASSAVLGGGTPITAEAARRLACDAPVRRIVSAPPAGCEVCAGGPTCACSSCACAGAAALDGISCPSDATSSGEPMEPAHGQAGTNGRPAPADHASPSDGTTTGRNAITGQATAGQQPTTNSQPTAASHARFTGHLAARHAAPRHLAPGHPTSASHNSPHQPATADGQTMARSGHTSSKRAESDGRGTLDGAAAPDGTGLAATARSASTWNGRHGRAPHDGRDPTARLAAALRQALASLPPPLGARSAVLDAGRATPTFTAPMKDALHAAYGGRCAFPRCGRPATVYHHIVHWAHGGPTSVANGAPLCEYHHYLVHEGGWHLYLDRRDAIQVVPPPPTWPGPRRLWRNGRLSWAGRQ